MDNVRNINGCPLAGLTPAELLDASQIVFDLDALLVGADGNPDFANLPRKLNVTITGCLENCTHAESQDIALVPAVCGDREGFNVLVGGKMGSGGFTIATPLDVFIGPSGAAALVAELVRIYRDHGPRDARGRCRFAFLIDEWGVHRLRAELTERIGRELPLAGHDARSARHNDHVGISRQKHPDRAAVGLCVPTGRVNPGQLRGLARIAEEYGAARIRLTTAQNAVVTDVPVELIARLLREPLLGQFSPAASPFVRGLVSCIGTDFCNLALIDTKRPALELARTLEQRRGTNGAPLTMHWSGCQAGCGNHQAADIGFRGHRATIDGKTVDAVAVYVGGRTGPDAAAGAQILESVPVAALPDVVERLLGGHEGTFSHGSHERTGHDDVGSAGGAAESLAAGDADAA
jgi:ferredoxin-nitrite reductase